LNLDICKRSSGAGGLQSVKYLDSLNTVFTAVNAHKIEHFESTVICIDITDDVIVTSK